MALTIRNAELDSIDAPACEFHESVVLENVSVAGESNFWAGYFFAGFQATRCRFGGPVDFQCGGHNKGPVVVTLTHCGFEGFVNFYDCWYQGPIVVRDCAFAGGTNLLGNLGEPYEVHFDVPPVIERNTGRLDLNGG